MAAKGLQVLVVPMYSKQELNADSNYVVYTTWVAGMRRVRPDWQFVILFPDKESGYTYEDDGFFRTPNVFRIPYRISPRKRSNAVSFDGVFYDELFRRFAFNVIWNNLIEISPQLKFAGETTATGWTVIVAAHNYVIHPSLPYPFAEMEHIAQMQILGALHADRHVFNSEHCRWMLYDNASRFLAPDVLPRLREGEVMIPYGTLEPVWPAPRRKEDDIPIIAYNHRLQAYKHYRETFALLESLHQGGARFRVRYMNNCRENLSDIQRYPFVEVRLCATRADYLSALAECHLNVSNSIHETFCIAAIESMAFGQPLVAPKAITFPEITGQKTTGYPYLFTTKEEQAAMLKRLLTDPEERRRWGTILSEYVRTNYNQDAWAERYAVLFEELDGIVVEEATRVKRETSREVFLRGLRNANGLSVKEAYRAIQAERDPKGLQNFSNQSLPRMRMLRMIQAWGGSVRIEKGIQRVYYEG